MARLFLQEPEPVCGENHRSRTGRWPDVDQPDTSRLAVDGFDEATQDRLKRFLPKRPEEVRNREIVGHPELRDVLNHDLHVLASVLMASGRQPGACYLGQLWGDLDAYNPAERPLCGLMHDSAFSTSEVDKGVAIGDSEVAERPGQHVPGRWQVEPSIMWHSHRPGGIEPSVQQAVCKPVQNAICKTQPAPNPVGANHSSHQPGPPAGATRAGT
jgi:hypothetical protein